MLVLTRKPGQKIIIQNNIEVTVLETRGDVVKIGIHAPRNVTIYREEIYEEIKRANRQSVEETSSAELDDLSKFFGNSGAWGGHTSESTKPSSEDSPSSP